MLDGTFFFCFVYVFFSVIYIVVEQFWMSLIWLKKDP